MSHELRTPLNAVIGFAEVLPPGKAGPICETQQEFLGQILIGGRNFLHVSSEGRGWVWRW